MKLADSISEFVNSTLLRYLVCGFVCWLTAQTLLGDSSTESLKLVVTGMMTMVLQHVLGTSVSSAAKSRREAQKEAAELAKELENEIAPARPPSKL